MIVTILPDKYRCGSKLGISSLDSPGYLEKLNRVIDFSKSKFPENKDGEIKDFLGTPPELKPGNMFLFEGQVFAIDSPERLILCITETGAFAITRFINEILESEVKLLEPSLIENVKITEENPPTEEIAIYKPNYYIMKSWREKVNLTKPIKIEFTSDLHVFPVTLWIKDRKIWYSQLWIDSEEIEITALEALRWTYQGGI